MDPLNKEKLQWKSFSVNFEWSSKKLRKIISTDIKTDVKQEIKGLVVISYKFSQKYLLMQYKVGLYFLFNLGWDSIQFDPLSVTKDICRRSLNG